MITETMGGSSRFPSGDGRPLQLLSFLHAPFSKVVLTLRRCEGVERGSAQHAVVTLARPSWLMFFGESSEQVQRLAVVGLPGALPPETLAWSPAERIACLLHLAVADIVEAPALREPVPEKAIGVLVGAQLPWMAGMAEAGRRSQRPLEALCIVFCQDDVSRRDCDGNL